MLEDIKILTSRRAYEFGPDDLRLSTLSIKPIQDQIQQLFQFQSSAVGTPFYTFGEVPLTIPPGLVFNSGVWFSSDELLVPIRFLHFEQRRIVIDVGGPSSIIIPIFDRLQEFLSQLQAADGSPIIGEPVQTLDYSEITARFPATRLDAMFVHPLRDLFNRVIVGSSGSQDSVLIPTLSIQAYPDRQTLSVVPTPYDSRGFTFALRAGTRPDEHVYLSCTPLDSDAHLAYLTDLEAALAS